MPECAYERSSAPRARGVMLPLAACLSNGTSGFFLGAGGGSRTHFSHPFLGCLLRVATRYFCSPSPEPIGLRWTSQPRPLSPGNFDRACQNRISLLKIDGARLYCQSISFHTSLATCLAASSVRTFCINSSPILK